MTEVHLGLRWNYLPTEILFKILTLLSAKEIIKCRKVCLRWKRVVDGLAKDEVLWEDHCKQDFNEVYTYAKLRCPSDILWYNIYMSLSLWPKINEAKEIRKDFAISLSNPEDIKHFEILQGDIIGLHRNTEITYYDSNTLEELNTNKLRGEFLRYVENEHAIVTLSFNLKLIIIQKDVHDVKYKPNAIFENVKVFILVGKEVYYVNLNDEIYNCCIKGTSTDTRFINVSEDGVLLLSYCRDKLHVLTFQRKLYEVVDGEFCFISYFGNNFKTMLRQLNEYNLLDRLDWRIYIQWMYMLNRVMPTGPIRDIVTVKLYGDMIFVGNNWGHLSLYYCPQSCENFDLYTAKPIKKYNFLSDRSMLPAMCPIIKIDVKETSRGHKIFVAVPKKIIMINFVHEF